MGSVSPLVSAQSKLHNLESRIEEVAIVGRLCHYVFEDGVAEGEACCWNLKHIDPRGGHRGHYWLPKTSGLLTIDRSSWLTHAPQDSETRNDSSRDQLLVLEKQARKLLHYQVKNSSDRESVECV
jgi:hypothetical protein